MPNLPNHPSIQIAIAWCLAWGTQPTPQYPIAKFNRWRSAIAQGNTPTDPEWQQALKQSETLIELGNNSNTLSITDIAEFIAQHPQLWESNIGLVYGGVTKVKSYVFESADLQEVRGASALLDRINLVDLPAFFHVENTQPSTHQPFEQCQQAPQYCQQIREAARSKPSNSTSNDTSNSHKPNITDALIPELIVYATGGNILAFCPAAFITDLCNAIEKRYTVETLCANACAVGEAFKPLEIYLGLLQDPIERTLWHDAIATQHKSNKAVQAYFGFADNASASDIKTAFSQRKNFGELVGKLTSLFNQRRSGCDASAQKGESGGEQEEESQSRPSRRYPPMFETHPYLMRDGSDIRSTVVKVNAELLPDEPQLSEPLARKLRVGQITKRDRISDRWYEASGFKALWNPAPKGNGEKLFQSWISKFERFLKDNHRIDHYDPDRQLFDQHDRIMDAYKREARSLNEIGASSNGYVAYIYADGNSMGQFIREQIKTPAQYQQFSKDVFTATEHSVYRAIADHITPCLYKPDAKSSRTNKESVWIHPFEIITIGGDDVLLVVPANKGLEVAQAIGQHFESILIERGGYEIATPVSAEQQKHAHRYQPALAPTSTCKLSTSSGVLITAANTPIYYAQNLVEQLQKTAKSHRKTLKDYGYYGGTVDFLVLKAVTMISSNIKAFRQEGLTLSPPNRNHILKLYAAPYTLYELGGLIDTVKALKQSGFPKSQLYQIRSLLERGKRTAILNYRYFRVRLAADKRTLIETHFEQAWCNASTNDGNLAPWLTAKTDATATSPTVYKTIWRELVELEPFIETDIETDKDAAEGKTAQTITAQTPTKPAQDPSSKEAL